MLDFLSGRYLSSEVLLPCNDRVGGSSLSSIVCKTKLPSKVGFLLWSVYLGVPPHSR